MNTKIWSEVEMTDTKYVKKNGNLSAINGQYFYKRATEIFGALGDGWGYEIKDDKFIDSAPMILNKENIGSGKIHTIKINFWYKNENGDKCSFEQYGHTRYMYLANSGKVIVDEDYAKKSLTDAVKKSLSGLGFCADVFLGMFEDSDYTQMVANKLDAERSLDIAEAQAKNKKDLLNWVKLQAGVYEKMPSTHACGLTLKKQTNQIVLKCRVLNENPDQLIQIIKSAHLKQVTKNEAKK